MDFLFSYYQFSSFIKDDYFPDNEADDIKTQCNYAFWMQIKQGPVINTKLGTHTWIEDFEGPIKNVTFLPWYPVQPNGRDLEQCVRLRIPNDNTYWDVPCSRLVCSLCEFKESVGFTLHGLPRNSRIDQHYVFVPQNQKFNTLKFTGHKTTEISWSYKTSQWKILDTSFKIPDLGHYNVSKFNVVSGRYSWRLTRYWDPNNDTPELRDLKLSKVYNTV